MFRSQDERTGYARHEKYYGIRQDAVAMATYPSVNTSQLQILSTSVLKPGVRSFESAIVYKYTQIVVHVHLNFSTSAP